MDVPSQALVFPFQDGFNLKSGSLPPRRQEHQEIQKQNVSKNGASRLAHVPVDSELAHILLVVHSLYRFSLALLAARV
jgi:hypothetical protein